MDSPDTRPSMAAETALEQPAGPLDILAVFNKAASDPLRLEVLRVLHHNSYGVLELSHILNVKQSALSHHLKILAQAGLVCTRREGNSIFYRRHLPSQDDALHELQQKLFGCIDDCPLSHDTLTRIRHIQQERAASSANFFREESARFEKQQERIATYPVYGSGVLELLRHSTLEHTECALEVGPGNGEFLIELSPLFKRVIALDNSNEMLARARQQTRLANAENIQFMHGDTQRASRLAGKEKIQVDCCVLNMVLHHTPSPADIFTDLYKLTNPAGLLLVTELCRHDQDWAKSACGDLWLGFDPDELMQWAKTAGFEHEQSVYQALRNGFQIQMHSFRKPSGKHHSFH